MRHMRLLPLLVFVAALSFLVRFGEVTTGYSVNSGAVLAVEEVNEEPPPLSGEAVEENSEDEGADGESSSAEPKTGNDPDIVDLQGASDEIWRDAGDEEAEMSGVSMELFEDLAARREELEQREREIVTREALLQAAEQELDQKYRELEILRGELEALLEKQSEEEEARIQSLVKIYEGMKSKDAARIFNTLDIDVLVEVMARMSERKLSPILADMNPERARAVTIILAQQKQLPELPQ